MPNRGPGPGTGLPVVLVPGRAAAALLAGRTQVRFSARIVTGTSENLLARFGDAGRALPLLIATPLSGWFASAAERGSGIALAIALAERFASRHPVQVLGSPGHELLPHIGLQALLADVQPQASLIVHLGANVALGRADGEVAWAGSRPVRSAPA